MLRLNCGPRTTTALIGAALVLVIALNPSRVIAEEAVSEPPVVAFSDEDEWRAPRFDKLADRLELTTRQSEAIAELRKENHDANLKIRKQLARLQNELEGAMLADEIDEAQVLGLVEQIGNARTDLRINRMRLKLEIRQLLTPEQRDQMLMLRQHRRGHRGPADRQRDHRGNDRHNRGRGERSGRHGSLGPGAEGMDSGGPAVRS